jgi:hypothetical protein
VTTALLRRPPRGQLVCNAATTTCNFDLIVKADVAASHIVVAVVGYYRKFPKPLGTQ